MFGDVPQYTAYTNFKRLQIGFTKYNKSKLLASQACNMYMFQILNK